MTRWLRFLLVTLRSWWLPRLEPDGTSVLTARVWPTDVDFSVANNAAYLVFFEMGRVDLQLRTGFARLAAKKGWALPMASLNVQFRKPLRRFQKFTVRARLLYWDDKWVYVEHRMTRKGETVATALSKSVPFGKEGPIPPLEVLAALGKPLPRPATPPMIERYEEAEKLMRDHVAAWSSAPASS